MAQVLTGCHLEIETNKMLPSLGSRDPTKVTRMLCSLICLLIHCIELDALKVLEGLPFFEILSTLLSMSSLKGRVFTNGLVVKRRIGVKDTSSHL